MGESSSTWMTKTETASYLGLSERRVDQLRASGELQAFVNPHTRAVRFSRQDVVNLKRARETFEPET
jgi:hypothetical protein